MDSMAMFSLGNSQRRDFCVCVVFRQDMIH